MQLPNNGWWFLTECIQWLTQPFLGWGDWDQFCNARICIYSIYIYVYIHVFAHTSLGISPSLLTVSCETQCMEFVELSYQTYPILLRRDRIPRLTDQHNHGVGETPVSSHGNGSLVLTTGEPLNHHRTIGYPKVIG